MIRLHVGTVDESHDDVVHAGCDLNGDFRETRHDFRASLRPLAVVKRLIPLPSIMITSVLTFSRVEPYIPTKRSSMVMRYSPSAGKLCLNLMPPRVPRGSGKSGS